MAITEVVYTETESPTTEPQSVKVINKSVSVDLTAETKPEPKTKAKPKSKSDKEHAYLSPSSAHRWLTCTKSAKLESSFPDVESPYALEGTKAHRLAEITLSRVLGLIDGETRDRLTVEWEQESGFSDTELEAVRSNVLKYINFIQETISALGKTPESVKVEQKVTFNDWVPSGFGMADCVIVSEPDIYIIDLKYGKGVRVDAYDNEQLKLYALGVYYEYSPIYDFDNITMVIAQPRLDNWDTATISCKDLLEWADTYVKPQAELAYQGKGKYVPSLEACRFCKAKAICKARAKEAQKVDKKLVDVLTNSEIVKLLPQIENIVAWCSDLKSYALAEALKGEKYSGFKVVEGRSVRKIANDDQAKQLLVEAGYPIDQIAPNTLLGLTALTKLLGKTQFEQVLEPVITKAKGSPTLVSDTDKRPEWAEISADDFVIEQPKTKDYITAEDFGLTSG